MTNAEVIARSAAYEMSVYARQPVAFVRGDGCELWDADGKRYLDFFAGLAVNNLGHCHPAVVGAIREQSALLLHASNVYHTPPAGELCALLCRHSFAERVFLSNSGAEANEAAMKLARRWGSNDGGGRFEILATIGSFHGRTFGTLTATGQEKYHTGFQPLLPGIRLVPFGDLAAMAGAVRDETVAIMVEPIQGEGGVVVPPRDYLPGLRALADRRKLLLILDEIQCGLGRTGRLFAHEHAGMEPDIMTIAKALGGGLPIGATCTTARIAAAFTPGAHGSTFGGNPVTCAAGVAALRALADPTLLEHVRAVGDHFRTRLEGLGRCGGIRNVRGMGLMLGVELDGPGAAVVSRCLAAGLLINCTADRILRFLPPLVITRAQVDEGFAILERALAA
ncbi:MAG TPA: aspartate aminotransferase family protein [Candidatus Binatus sp.]|nr:aspartate aminotransferase family protein [Candidatus Binatus sp.]